MKKNILQNEILEAKKDLAIAISNKNYTECHYIQLFIDRREKELKQSSYF